METLYAIFLPLHNLLRWVVVITALLAIGRALAGWLGKRPWTALDRKAGLWFTIAMDVQVLVGLILYFFLSPITLAALRNFGGAMSESSLRYFAVEHIIMMIIALVLAHVGSARARKAANDLAKHRNAAIWFILAFLIILAAIPWPFLAVGRPWIRF
jgi:hypothetical protein